jgi:hypothetical protein
VGHAIVAVIPLGLVFGVALFLFAPVLTGLPVVGFVAGAGGMVFALAHTGPLLLEAVVNF